MAGPNGSIQGPCEAKWGYTTLTVADWDGDGLPDLVVNSIWGKVVWYQKHRHAQGAEARRRAADRSRVGRPAADARLRLAAPGRQGAAHPVAHDAGRGRLEQGRPDRPRDARPRRLSRLLRARATRRQARAAAAEARVLRREGRAVAAERRHRRRQRPAQALRRRLGRRRQARHPAQRRQRNVPPAGRRARRQVALQGHGPARRAEHRRPRRQPDGRRLQRRRLPTSSAAPRMGDSTT